MRPERLSYKDMAGGNMGEIHLKETGQDLYIYLFDGVVRERDEALFGDTYLGNWVEGDNSFLFFSRPAEKPIKRLLNNMPGLELVDDFHFTHEQWQGRRVEPFRVGQFLIVPPWEKTAHEEKEARIILDPGVVFGNGLHPTTRDSLKALSLLKRIAPFELVMDVGTGTGILAIAASLLGARRVIAIDLNPLCVKTARKNVHLNRLERNISVVEGSVKIFLEEPADLVIANIHHEVTRGLLEKRTFREKDRLIVSGLMRSQARELRYQLERKRFEIIHEWDHEMTWFTILAEKG